MPIQNHYLESYIAQYQHLCWENRKTTITGLSKDHRTRTLINMGQPSSRTPTLSNQAKRRRVGQADQGGWEKADGDDHADQENGQQSVTDRKCQRSLGN